MSSATECAQLRIRIIALENLVIALLVQAPERQRPTSRRDRVLPRTARPCTPPTKCAAWSCAPAASASHLTPAPHRSRFRHEPGRGRHMKTLRALHACAMGLSAATAASAQSGHMTGNSWGSDWMGGYGGPWLPVLVLVAVIALAVWVVKRK
jgi:hypothetical protein